MAAITNGTEPQQTIPPGTVFLTAKNDDEAEEYINAIHAAKGVVQIASKAREHGAGFYNLMLEVTDDGRVVFHIGKLP